jgi:hypothetical protein
MIFTAASHKAWNPDLLKPFRLWAIELMRRNPTRGNPVSGQCRA